jgi:hypothetical protein
VCLGGVNSVVASFSLIGAQHGWAERGDFDRNRGLTPTDFQPFCPRIMAFLCGRVTPSGRYGKFHEASRSEYIHSSQDLW